MSSDRVGWPVVCFVCGSQTNICEKIEHTEKVAGIGLASCLGMIKVHFVPIQGWLCENGCESVLKEKREERRKYGRKIGKNGCIGLFISTIISFFVLQFNLGFQILAVFIGFLLGLVLIAYQLELMKNPVHPYIKISSHRTGLKYKFKNEAFRIRFSELNPNLKTIYQEDQL